MALFKINKGDEINLPAVLTEGWAYFTTDNGNFYIDHLNNQNELVRTKISANYADKLRYIENGETIEINPKDILLSGHTIGQKGEAEGSEIFNDYQNNVATGVNSKAEGGYTSATGAHAHAEGYHTTASGFDSHSEGNYTFSSGAHSHSEGNGTQAIGSYSHAEGDHTQAIGQGSHSEGLGTKAYGRFQKVSGTYNIEDNDNLYIHIVGNGKQEDEKDEEGHIISQYRSNAYTLDWNGNAWFAGDITVGENNEKLVTDEDINKILGDIETALDNIIAEQEAIIAIQNSLIGGDSV